MPRARLGAAIIVPQPVAGEIDGLRKALGDPSLGRIPAHVTLVPPVNVADVGAAVALVAEAASAQRPFRLGLGPPASFWPDSPVVYLEVREGLEAVRSLHGGLMRPPLSRELGWPFVPHVTLIDGATPETIPALVEHLGSYRADVDVDSVHLLREHEDRSWRPVAGPRLAGQAVVGRGGLPLVLSAADRAEPEAREWAEAITRRFAEDAGLPEGQPFAITARREGAVVGLVEGCVAGETSELHRVVVGPAARGQGVGGHLLAAAESLCAERGATSCTMAVPGGGSAEMLRERGWQPVRSLDGLVLTRQL